MKTICNQRDVSMLLKTEDGSELELRIVGYESPHPEFARDDWLVIYVRMRIGSESWSAKDPALVWEEARDLSHWLDEISDVEVDDGSSIGFTEPTLYFEAFRRTQDRIALRVYCQKFPKSFPDEHFSKIFLLNPEHLKKGAEELRSELQQFPSRFPLE